MKVGCLIYYWGKRYEKIGKIAVNSFKKFHPDVNLHVVNDISREEYKCAKFFDLYGGGIHKYMLACEIMAKNKYDKMIVVGADTITCARLDEFIDDKESDLITTSDYCYQPSYVYGEQIIPGFFLNKDEDGNFCLRNDLVGNVKNVAFYLHSNADVVCFNNLNCLKEIIDLSIVHKKSFELMKEKDSDKLVRYGCDYWAEQGGLNLYIINSLITNSNKIHLLNTTTGNPLTHVANNSCFYLTNGKLTFYHKKLSYNVQTKGFNCEEGFKVLIPEWKIEEDKLYDFCDREIKIFHYCEGFGLKNDNEFESLINKYIFEHFNNDTKHFFKSNFETDGFFDNKFAIQ
jgi:hypothetical protein